MTEHEFSTTSRRSFLLAGAALGAGIAARGMPAAFAAQGKEFTVPPLPYRDDELEPHIDTMTMQIHHGKHHAAYVQKLNETLAKHEDLRKLSLEELLANGAAKAPEDIRQTVINHGGGHSNHSLFWTVLGPAAKMAKEPGAKLLTAVKSQFTSLDALKTKMTEAGMGRFGSGWSWLVKDRDGRLEVMSSANQDSPLLSGKTPILGIDVWEHAYYLKYQNRRADYLKAIWNVVNWDEATRRYG
jgi:Fe-Mn family superoxide dismutase